MELFAADGHDAGGCERVTGKSGMRPSLLTVDDVEHLEARMISGFLGNDDRAEEVFLVGEVPVLRGLEYLFFDVLLELIPVSRSPNVPALKERNQYSVSGSW